jgi:hypothetical protein
MLGAAVLRIPALTSFGCHSGFVDARMTIPRIPRGVAGMH